MILVKVDVIPRGDYSKQKQIGEIKIANITGPHTYRMSSDYKYQIKSEDGETVFEGTIIDSYNGNAFELISECLNAWNEGWIVTPDNHGDGGVRVKEKTDRR
ncbi:hypothetical protein WH95_06210 [Kiloniella litopenaei]|uniref:Uncharacterized protein n=1 Tax=Kiloniella litopenaei TaxID=1549748 RepID=A0A0M2RC35_9PROT|nr:hypothetical protein [Kiloniella litopenaei]KKJ77994.1 hypothetical protein WH95_06210 [Kiloniella litopenaei]